MKRVDQNQSRIVKELRQMGYSVVSLADVGDGCPDIAVGGVIPCPHCGSGFPRNLLVEIKNWQLKPSQRRLTPKEKLWHQDWKGQVSIAETTGEILGLISGKRQ